ncbi:PQQ-dependent sugar dehydrogenase [Alloyangia pacifica]|uniref:PQQ-dependent sugar dehydrogenase n=1 Tax=Alloyangia pacifica TaxID=311180 RepID=UPI001CD6F520|nr:PQQ-dependent sugar dehydrogenase [Alloyangia pacifica]MCA0996373.1 PQQ-dependent sugar dehydrogenase [Alloyangia pacifica]
MRDRFITFSSTLSVMLALAGGPALALETSAGEMRITPVVDGLEMPWGFDFLPGGGVLITEKAGVLLRVKDGRAEPLSGLPEVADSGQGGLLDVLVPEDFAQSREVFMTYAKPQEDGGAGTAVLRAVLPETGTALQDVQVIFEMTQGNSSGRHFGSRLVEGPDDTLFVTVGERGEAAAAQDLSRHNGSVLRIGRDGSVPQDNPFIGTAGAQAAIWSFGHRNPQGAAMDAEGRLWVAEHGAKGGDEVNLIERAGNYGWPVISYGTHYSGAKIGEGTEKPGMTQPVFYWDPSIAPSGMVFLEDSAVPAWDGDALVGSLKFDFISRLSGAPLREVERIEAPETGRVRDVDQGPDGAIWFLSEIDGTLYRMTPKTGAGEDG